MVAYSTVTNRIWYDGLRLHSPRGCGLCGWLSAISVATALLLLQLLDPVALIRLYLPGQCNAAVKG